MSAPIFVDTNVLVYARDASEVEKQPRAEAWMRHLWATHQGYLSQQVLHEFYVTVTRKLDPGLSPEVARQDVRALLAWEPLALDAQTMEGAWDLEDRHSLSWWDALIVSAARVARCSVLLTEDLQDGYDFDGVRIVNPFLNPPEVDR
jgi:predicted nucleic acid-binding protein